MDLLNKNWSSGLDSNVHKNLIYNKRVIIEQIEAEKGFKFGEMVENI